MKNLLQNWLISVLIGAGIFFVVRPSFAQIFARQVEIAQYVVTNTLTVNSEVIDGYQQAYFVYEGNRVYVTDHEGQNSYQVDSKGEYMAWITTVNGAGQIFRHHIPTGETIQITDSSTNGQPKVDSSGSIVWERWVGDSWQVYLFDGQAVRQVSSGGPAVDPDIEDGVVVYSQKSNESDWKAIKFGTKTRKYSTLKEGTEAKYVAFDRTGDIEYAADEFANRPTTEPLKNITSPPEPTPPPPTDAVDEEDLDGEEVLGTEDEVQETPTPTVEPIESTVEPTEPEETPTATPEPTVTPTQEPSPTTTPPSEPEKVTIEEVQEELESILFPEFSE